MIEKGKMRTPPPAKSDADIVAQVSPGPSPVRRMEARTVADQIVRKHADQIREAISKLTRSA